MLKDDYTTIDYVSLNQDQQGKILYTDSSDPLYSSSILTNSNVETTLTWNARTITEKEYEISQYDVKYLNPDNSIGNKNARYGLITNNDTLSKFKETYNNTSITTSFNIFKKYIEVLNENPYNSIDIFKHLYFKINIIVPVNGSSREEFSSVAKYDDDTYSIRKNKGNPLVNIIEHQYDLWDAFNKSYNSIQLTDTYSLSISSNKRNVYKLYNIDERKETNSINEHIFTKEKLNFNMIDMILISLFYQQLTATSKNTLGIKTIGENEFYAIIDSIISTFAYEGIIIPIDLIYQKTDLKKAEYISAGNSLFPITLKIYIDLIKSIIFNTDVVLRYMRVIKRYHSSISNPLEQRTQILDQQLLEYLTTEETFLESEIDNVLKINPIPQPPFDIEYYHRMFETDANFPSWRIGNIPESIRRKIELTVNTLESYNLNTASRDIIRILWRIDYIQNVIKNKDTDIKDLSYPINTTDTNNHENQKAYKEELFEQFFDNYAPRKYIDFIQYETYKEAFLVSLFDTGFSKITIYDPKFIKLSEQNDIYKALQENPKLDGTIVTGEPGRTNNNDEWKWKINLDKLFSSQWTWPFNLHLLDYAHIDILKTEYDFIVNRLTILQNNNIQHHDISLVHIEDLKTKLDNITSSDNTSSDITPNSKHDIYEASYNELDNAPGTSLSNGNTLIEPQSIYNLKQSEYDGFFYNNNNLLNMLEQKSYEDSTFQFLSDEQYDNDRKELFTSLNTILDTWINELESSSSSY